MPAAKISQKWFQNGSNLAVLSICLLFLLAHFNWCFLSIYNMDDINYIRYAAQISYGNPPELTHPDHFSHRLLAIYVTAIPFSIFGISILTSSFFGLLTTFGSCISILFLTRNQSLEIRYLSVLGFLLTYSTIFASHRLWPDTGIVLLLLLTIIFYLKYQEQKAIIYSLFCGITLFGILLAKETIVVILPALLIMVIRDIVLRKDRKFHLYCTLTFLFLVCAYLLMYYVQTGSAFYRYRVLINNSYLNECSFDLLPWTETAKRISYKLFLAFISNGDGIVMAPALLSCYYSKQLNLGNELKTIQQLYFLLFVSSNFMSISYTHYIPLCHDARHFLFLIPLAAISASPLLARYSTDPKSYPLLPVTFFFITIILFYVGGGEMKYIYLLIGMLLSGIYFAPLNKYAQSIVKITPILFVLCLSIRPNFDFFNKKHPEYNDQKKIIDSLSHTAKKDIVIYHRDPFLKEVTEFSLAFDSSKIKPRVFIEGMDASLDTGDFLLVDRFTPPQQTPKKLKKVLQSLYFNLYEVTKDE